MTSDFSYHFFSSTISAWEGMYKTVLGATKSIYWEIYIFVDDKAGNRFIDLLCDKARQGVDVKIIVDAIGSFGLSKTSINRLKSSGAEVLFFHPLTSGKGLRAWWSRLWLRNHCKVLIVDERAAFIGGVNVQYHMENWDDLQLQLNGKVVRPLMRYFARKYIGCGGKRKNIKHLLHPKLSKQLNEVKSKVRFIMQSPKKFYPRSSVRKFYYQALKSAKESFTLLTPYYAPDRKFLQLIYRASKRGVKVNVILPYKNDVRLMHYMARAFYAISKKMGVKFNFLKNMNHGKALTVDNKLGMVGSANLTNRSYFLNHETNVVFKEKEMVDELNHILDNWKDQADPQLEQEIKKGGIIRRIKEWWAMRLKDYV